MRWRLFTNPVFTGFVALLAVNDRILKSAWPGLVTGKLSDIAGVAVIAIILTALTGRAAGSAAVTAVTFSALKLWPPVALAVAPVLGGVTRTDPTDLAALAVLWPVTRWCARMTNASGPRWSAVFAPACLFLALSATTATSCYTQRSTIAGLRVEGNKVVATVGEGNSATESTSSDGGATWSTLQPTTIAPALHEQVCDDSTCWRVRGHDRLEESSSGDEWRTAFTFTTEQRRRLRYGIDTCNGDGDMATWFNTVDTVRRADGAHLVVGMGSNGVLHRRPDGTWDRPRIDADPDNLSVPQPGPPRWWAKLAVVSLLLVLISPATFAFMNWKGRPRHSLAGSLIALVGGLILVGVVGLSTLNGDMRIPGMATAVAAVVLFVISVVVTLRPKQPRRLPPPWPGSQIR